VYSLETFNFAANLVGQVVCFSVISITHCLSLKTTRLEVLGRLIVTR
jgi:hypothetical protein